MELSDLWIDSEENHGQVTGRGNQIRFSEQSIEKMPPEVVEICIVHEIAHVDQWALTVASTMTKEEREKDADKKSRAWGFDPCVLTMWEFKQAAKKMPDASEETV